jgi:hypothetical protein
VLDGGIKLGQLCHEVVHLFGRGLQTGTATGTRRGAGGEGHWTATVLVLRIAVAGVVLAVVGVACGRVRVEPRGG